MLLPPSMSNKDPQPLMQPQPARGVKIAAGVGVGLLALLALAVWGLIRVFSG